MPTNPESSEACGPSRKRTLSTKVTTNGDPNAERKRKKLEEAQKKGATTALTKKKPTTSTKAAPAKKTAMSASAKPAPQYLKLYVDDSTDSDDIRVDTSIASEPITIEDSDDD